MAHLRNLLSVPPALLANFTILLVLWCHGSPLLSSTARARDHCRFSPSAPVVVVAVVVAVVGFLSSCCAVVVKLPPSVVADRLYPLVLLHVSVRCFFVAIIRDWYRLTFYLLQLSVAIIRRCHLLPWPSSAVFAVPVRRFPLADGGVVCGHCPKQVAVNTNCSRHSLVSIIVLLRCASPVVHFCYLLWLPAAVFCGCRLSSLPTAVVVVVCRHCPLLYSVVVVVVVIIVVVGVCRHSLVFASVVVVRLCCVLFSFMAVDCHCCSLMGLKCRPEVAKNLAFTRMTLLFTHLKL